MLATARELTRTAITFQSKTWRNERTRSRRLAQQFCWGSFARYWPDQEDDHETTIAGTIRH
jgi:hypothetical protein